MVTKKIILINRVIKKTFYVLLKMQKMFKVTVFSQFFQFVGFFKPKL